MGMVRPGYELILSCGLAVVLLVGLEIIVMGLLSPDVFRERGQTYTRWDKLN
jgi:hypothetical protein